MGLVQGTAGAWGVEGMGVLLGELAVAVPEAICQPIGPMVGRVVLEGLLDVLVHTALGQAIHEAEVVLVDNRKPWEAEDEVVLAWATCAW